MSKVYSGGASSGSKAGVGLFKLLALAAVVVILGIGLLTHGVPPLVGVVIAVVGAFVIDKALFEAWK